MFRLKENKKAQEEMVGFVLIVVLAAVVFLVFIGISARQASVRGTTESIDVSQFLDSALQVKTKCSIDGGVNYLTIDAAIRHCDQDGGKKCTSGERVCEVLGKEMPLILESAWPLDGKRPVKGLDFRVVDEANTPKRIVYNYTKGTSAEPLVQKGVDRPLPQKITVSLKIYEEPKS